jgi:hypothetical protein
MGGDKKMVTRPQGPGFFLVKQKNIRVPLEDQHPFMLFLIVDGAGLAGGSDPFHPETLRLKEAVSKFSLRVKNQAGKEVIYVHAFLRITGKETLLNGRIS